MEPKIILHGGIESIEETNKEEKEEALEYICRTTYKHLKEKRAVDAVEFAISMMEDSPYFNAGTSAILQADGTQRMDASIMDGYNFKAGAVAQISAVRNPIKVARLVMEKSSHCLIVGKEAQIFAYINGVGMYNPITKNSIERYLRIKEEQHCSTVGVVAIDKDGKIAAGTSTGGWATSFPGRVGDVPIIGAGTYANEQVGVSCTGHGEKILTICLARLVSFYIESYALKEAVEKSLEKLKKINGIGGLIAIDFTGNIAFRATEGAYMPISYMPK